MYSLAPKIQFSWEEEIPTLQSPTTISSPAQFDVFQFINCIRIPVKKENPSFEMKMTRKVHQPLQARLTKVKSAELTQPFGYVWNYINSPDVSHKKCKGHEHSAHEQIKPKKSPSLKTSFVVESSLFKLGYSSVSNTNNTKTIIFYKLLNDKGNVLKSKTNITFDNTLEQKWDTTTIDLSAYKDQTITIVVGIKAQEENSSLLINLFQ